MADYFRLVQNENMKIYRRPRTYIMSAILVSLVLIISIMWATIGGRDVSMWDVTFIESSILFVLVTIFTVVVAAGGVAEEFTSGTIKLLLIRPWSRSKILLSKYIANVLFAMMLAILLFASAMLVNWVCFGLFNDAAPAATITNELGLSDQSSPFIFMMKYYGLTLISSIVTVTLAFMLSTLFRSSGVSIGVALFLLLAVNSASALLLSLDYKWIDYILFLHLDLTQYLMPTFPLREGMSLGNSLMILGVYYVIFMAVTFYSFNKRDVAA